MTAGTAPSGLPSRPTAKGYTLSYAYDRLYRLTAAGGGPAGYTTYTYDPVGNRLTRTRNGTNQVSYAYDKVDRITSAGAVGYTVNDVGNTTVRGSDTLAYDQANRLTSTTVGSTTATYVYDGDGKRASKTVGSTTTSYLYDINRGLPVLLEDGTRRYVWGLGLAYEVEGTSALVYHVDGLGFVRAITNSTKAVVQTYESDEFGVPITSAGGSSQPFGFTGEQRDSENGLTYLRARYYDPQLGRFVSRDRYSGRVGVPASLNRYSYVHNNPLVYSDPSGKRPAKSAAFSCGDPDDRINAEVEEMGEDQLEQNYVRPPDNHCDEAASFVDLLNDYPPPSDDDDDVDIFDGVPATRYFHERLEDHVAAGESTRTDAYNAWRGGIPYWDGRYEREVRYDSSTGVYVVIDEDGVTLFNVMARDPNSPHPRWGPREEGP